MRSLLTLLVAMAIPANLAPAQFELEDETPIVESKRPDMEVSSSMASSLALEQQLNQLERRVMRLEAKAIDASEAEEIAEQVVQRHIKEIRLAINTPSGGQRLQTVQFSNPNDPQSFQLAPGETLSSYTNTFNGSVTTVGAPTGYVQSVGYAQPIPQWQTSTVEMRMQPYTVQEPRRVEVRPVINGPIRRALNTQSRRYVMPSATFMGSSAGTCRIVNGVRVCN